MLESDVCLLRDLISLHPIHGGSSRSASQFEAARIIYERLVTDGWDEVLFDDYFSRELASHPLFVDTVAFGPDFSRDPHIQKRNVIARVDSGKLGPCLILNGHFDVDVVSTPEAWRRPDFWLSAERCGDQIYGRGSSDMLGGLVGLLAASKAFLTENKDWTGSLVFMAVVDEEIGGNGTLHAIEQCIKMGWIQPSASCLIAEPSDRQVCNASLGFAAFDLTFTRSTCHMGASSGAESAMRDFVMCLQTLDQDLRHAANLSGLILEDVAPIANVGVVSGGIDPSIPLGLLTARGVLFYPPSVNRDLFLKEAATAISQRFPNTLHFFFRTFGFDGARFESGALVIALMESPKAPPSLSVGTFRSPSDARIFAHYGIETVLYGPGSLEQAHSVDEFISTAEIRIFIEHCANAFGKFLRQSEDDY